ncbi:hypothetical protein Cadr_000008442 [Camelus dromedarius]|uniref:Uncharacterized protein n=1 Tax=Camelus dromedarius TaxID=9838 RepID=A0A5N4DZG1_CAMDR|nr:hypothetical protein Cadr_000008442 [Camelus dromedarius]
MHGSSYPDLTPSGPSGPQCSQGRGSVLPNSCESQQGDQECEQVQAQPLGVQLRPLRVTYRGAAQGLQGQAGPQVHQEKEELTNVLAAMRKAAAKKDRAPPLWVK